ncbi:hypothetical protein [Streptomyces sp. NPDC056796]|uniref:hypothetical protein n=1 Tax=Streptomyces sp. NPDC056796 TaxID=3345947 RepID=UPI003689B1BE
MSPSDWTRLNEAHGVRRRMSVVGRHVVRRPLLILALAGLAFLIGRFGRDLPVLFGMAPLGAVVILAGMGRYRSTGPAAESDGKPPPEEPLPRSGEAN